MKTETVSIDWCRNRRSWCGAEFDHQSGDVGYLTKPGVTAGWVQA